MAATETVELVPDRANIAYHALTKAFVLYEDIPESLIQDLLVLYDGVLSNFEVNLDKAYDGDMCFIHRLAQLAHFELIENFIDLGIDINAKSKSDGSTAAHYIVKHGDSESTRKLLQFLLENGADFNIANDAGFSALDLCGYKLSRFVQQLQAEHPVQVPCYDFSKDDIQQTFGIFDRTKTGYLSIAEIKHTIYHLKLGFNVSDSLMDYMFSLCDTSGDGQISLHEFEKMVQKTINGVRRPLFDDAKLAQFFRKKIQTQEEDRNIPLDFVFIPRNIRNEIALQKANKHNQASDDKESEQESETVNAWINIEPAHGLIDGESIANILKQCDLNFTKLERIYQLYFTNNGRLHHTYTKFEEFMKAFKSAENKYKKKLKRLFYTFSEEHTKLVNGRLLFICLAGVLAQYTTHFDATLEDLARVRADFVFRLLDVHNEQTIGLFEIAWLLRAGAIFSKTEDEILKKSQLLLTAAGAKRLGERVQKDSFNEVVLRFPSIIFTKVV
eukprot:CAMPEP_0197048466 /NCGR_PEP_ID=MMETSP1384-20130603/23817_1 /TAXON_ID=29189 /ORGANISM="Ammonia sp." /LENGTH=499 /DNA_ID=CAMNT_0042480609 /DNA_START=6 /DNA_END=1505 /DNA_ORIENTATION=-